MEEANKQLSPLLRGPTWAWTKGPPDYES